MKKKEVKRMYNDNYTLNNAVNNYIKQKNLIETEFLDLLVNTENVSEEESKQILNRKKQLYKQQY